MQIPSCRFQYTMPSPHRKAWRKTKMSPEGLCVCFSSVSNLNFSEQNILRLELIFFGNGADHLAGHPRSDDAGGNVMSDDASRPDNRAPAPMVTPPQTVEFAPIQTFSSSVMGAEVPMPWLRCSGSMA